MTTRNLSKPAILGAPYDLSNTVVCSPLWPVPSAHRAYWETHTCAHLYEYDPSDDGQEWFVSRVILSAHTPAELVAERAEHKMVSEIYDILARTMQDPGIVEALRLRGVRV